MIEQTKQQSASDAYDMIDRFLRNNLYDDDYAEYSAALESVCVAAAQPVDAEETTYEEKLPGFQRSALVDGEVVLSNLTKKYN